MRLMRLIRPSLRLEKSDSSTLASTRPPPLAVTFHQHQPAWPRRNFSRHATAPVHWRFEQPYFSVLSPQLSPSSFPTRGLQFRVFQDAPRAHRSVSAFQTYPLRLQKRVAREFEASCV